MISCPEITPVKTNKPKECYAAWNNNDKDYKTTTSGGMATLFARKIIEDGGIVYGACMQNDGVVQHIRIEDNEELEKIKGSKYTFSSIVDCYSLIKKDIENEKKVLFIGTPCQVAAMKKMFSTSDLFYAIDLICHGTPPASYFQEYLSMINIEPADDLKVCFRNKRYWLTIHNKGNIVYLKRYNKDPYFFAFMNNLIFRENCYKCQYSCKERCGDITLGDFWGLNRDSSVMPEFVSCVFLNTLDGERMFNSVKDKCSYTVREVDEAINGNDNLKHASYRPKEKDTFNKYYIKSGFRVAIKHSSIYAKIQIENIKDFLLYPYRVFKYGKDYKKLL